MLHFLRNFVAYLMIYFPVYVLKILVSTGKKHTPCLTKMSLNIFFNLLNGMHIQVPNLRQPKCRQQTVKVTDKSQELEIIFLLVLSFLLYSENEDFFYILF